MSIQDDLFFFRQVSNRLKLLKQVDRYKFGFRCWYCGDSKKNEYLTRGTIYPVHDHLQYGCFNCGKNVPFQKFLKEFDPSVYKDYVRAKFKNETEAEEVQEEVKPEDLDFPALFKLSKAFPVSASSKAMNYLKSRLVTKTKEIYYTNDSSEIVAKYKPDMKPEKVERFRDLEAIMFPLMTLEKAVIGVQLRFLEGDFRYLTLKFHEDFPKLYSIPDLDLEEDIWVTEGIFDALMLPNGLANLDASLSRIAVKTGLPKNQFILVHDNEPRNRDVMREMRRSVEKGFRVFFWPSWAKDYGKDLNEIKKNSKEAFSRLMEEAEVCSGLRAKLEFKKFTDFS